MIMNDKKMRNEVLVTGGAGFIGSHLCEKLLQEGNKVYCLDDFSTGQRKNIEKFLVEKNFTLIEQNLCDDIKHEFKNLSTIFNFACPASPVHYQRIPMQTLKVCTLGVFNIVDLAEKYNSKIIHSSTSEVYGDPKEHPQSENYWGNVNSYGPRACYDEGKRCAEAILYESSKKTKLDIRILRIFNTYGPNMAIDDGRVVSNFIVQALKNEDITIHGQGKQTRSFQYISDLLEGISLLSSHKTIIDKPINFGNPNEMTIKELAENILKLIPNSKSKIVYTEKNIDDPQRRLPDINKAKSILNWEPKNSLNEGLKDTIEYFKRTLS
jgi:UDP-glucuronate decarboxylase